MTFTAFNITEVELRSGSAATTKDVTTPAGYRIRFDCGHTKNMSNQDISEHLVDSDRYDPSINGGMGGSSLEMICPGCKLHERGSCKYTPLHKVTDMTPLYSRHMPKDTSFKLASEKGEGEVDPFKTAVDNWFSIYQNVPTDRREAFRKSLDLKAKNPQLFIRLFSSADWGRESQDISSELQERLSTIESKNK